MYRHIKEWDETLTARGLPTAALVHRIQDGMFVSEDKKRFGTKWTPNHAREGRYTSLFLICRTGHTCLRKGNAVLCSLSSVVCRMTSKHLKQSKMVRGPTYLLLIGIWLPLVSPPGLVNRYGAILFALRNRTPNSRTWPL